MRLTMFALGAAMSFFSTVALAQGGDVQITHPWARATPGGAQTGAAYVTIESPSGDKLTSVSTPAAKKAEIHSMTMKNGVMEMRRVQELDLPAGKPVTLKPGGYHIMLMQLAKPLAAGESFPLTLNFAKAGMKQVTVTVEKVGAMGPESGSGGGMNMPGMKMHQ